MLTFDPCQTGGDQFLLTKILYVQIAFSQTVSILRLAKVKILYYWKLNTPFDPLRRSITSSVCCREEHWPGLRRMQLLISTLFPWTTYSHSLGGVFDHPDHAGCAGDRLLTLRRGRCSVADYAFEFGNLAAEGGCNELAFLCAFRRGPNDAVRDILVTRARLGNLSEIIDRAIVIDNYQRERHQGQVCSPPP